MPYMVATNMAGTKKSNFYCLDSKEYARSCLNTVGFLKRTNGHPSHAIQVRHSCRKKWVAGQKHSLYRIVFAGSRSPCGGIADALAALRGHR